MTYEFSLFKDRAELLKEEFGEGVTLSPDHDPKFLKVKITLESNWDVMNLIHSSMVVGRKDSQVISG